MDHSDVVVCSFYTADDYYRDHADQLRKNLADLGLHGELEEVAKGADEDWADICRRKIAFLGRICDRFPDAKVFWIDVDCRLHDLPAYVTGSTADLVGFQRGFGAPSTIGYANRTRFWEPCFFGIGTSPAARKFVADAVALEAASDLKATDDYFFEESWRSNAPSLSFQVIPSAAVTGRSAPGVAAFFTFGSSGNVAEFKSKVVQHDRVEGVARRAGTARQRALRTAKAVERRLAQRSGRLTDRLRLVADRSGLTHALTQGSHQPAGTSRHRQALVNQMVVQGQRGDLEGVRSLAARLNASSIPTVAEAGAQRAAESFAHYAREGSVDQPLPLSWWSRPFPGNFGDWLSPLVLQAASQRPVTYLSPTAPTLQPHLVMVGSIGRFVRSRSIVVGTGIASEEIELDGRAHYVSLRGPVTADLLRRQGGPSVTSLGDPGVLLSRLLPVERGETNGRVALVRHFKHASLPLTLPEDMDELSVLMSHPDEIRAFMETLAGYRAVVTSAMHVMIACHSYGIPCALVGFRGFEDAVHGSGIKYDDYARGAGLTERWDPVVVDLDLRRTRLDDLLREVRISDAKLDEVEAAVAAGIAAYQERTA
ncbi:Polysaccharide pyruvyl transferase [Nocardioides scoriae]|uniref:Polysaccharide pyruvyl transferase n=1 Tax=Nocardioides scoriae TaxID=642780 RepID=A0A1H1MVR5_9ACTN|nr:polysaccharide pyruvyl transferase family protein [Nocardioides scoriae]SDR90953.1 Polysaccharide pyruvyl transferase [Nocardioides scoriae]